MVVLKKKKKRDIYKTVLCFSFSGLVQLVLQFKHPLAWGAIAALCLRGKDDSRTKVSAVEQSTRVCRYKRTTGIHMSYRSAVKNLGVRNRDIQALEAICQERLMSSSKFSLPVCSSGAFRVAQPVGVGPRT